MAQTQTKKSMVSKNYLKKNYSKVCNSLIKLYVNDGKAFIRLSFEVYLL